jgi:N4-gp56 family major capsid protein
MDTSYAFADPRAQTKWAKERFAYSMPNIMMTPLMGSNGSSFIHVNKDLLTQPGKNVVFDADQPISGAGVGDDGDTTGKAQQMKLRNMTVNVHQRSTRVQSAGAYSEQITNVYGAEGFRKRAMEQLSAWDKECIENDILTAAYGGYNENSGSSEIETINESYPTTNRIYYGGQSAAGTLGHSGVTYGTDALLTAGTQTDNLMGTKLLEMIKRKAVACAPRIRGGKVIDLSKATKFDVRTGPTGTVLGYFFIVFIHPLQTKAIREETGDTGWKEAMAQAQVRGNQNPIFSGAAFMWDGMIVWEYDRVPTRTGAAGKTLAEGFLLNTLRTETTDACANTRTVARAFLMGAQAICFAWARHPDWKEDFYDVDKGVVKTTMMYGAKRSNFNEHGTTTAGEDEAIYCIDTEVITD